MCQSLALSTAISDLATHQMVAGTARLMFAALILMELGFGMSLGYTIIYFWPSLASSSSSSIISSVSLEYPTIPIRLGFNTFSL